MVRKALRVGVAVMAVIVVSGLAGLELSYRSLLPADLPQPSKHPVPDLLKRTLWAYDFRGDGEPRLRPVFPFIVGSLIRGREAPQNLAAGVARYYGRRERSYQYTLHQLALATWVSRNWSADDAINTYASHIWMGSNHVGADDGALFLFSKAVGELTISETALLVATARSPGGLSPSCHPERAVDARQAVLDRMRAAGLISEVQLSSALAAPLGVRGSCEDSDTPPRPTS